MTRTHTNQRVSAHSPPLYYCGIIVDALLFQDTIAFLPTGLRSRVVVKTTRARKINKNYCGGENTGPSVGVSFILLAVQRADGSTSSPCGLRGAFIIATVYISCSCIGVGDQYSGIVRLFEVV